MKAFSKIILKILRFLFDYKYRLIFLFSKGFFNWLDDERYIKLLYKLKIGKNIDLINPQTFNEKLNWLKLYDRNPEYIKMVDKYQAKKIVAEKIGEQYIIPTLGIWDKFRDIDFSKLPDQFVLKTTHDSGGIVIVKDKNNFKIKEIRKKIEYSLKNRYFYKFREWPYKNVKPRIIAEQYMSNNNEEDLIDYKFYCFNGEPKVLLIVTGRHSKDGVKMTFFDMDFHQLKLKKGHPNSKEKIIAPKCFEKMKEFSKILSSNISFLRCDFYETEGKLYFGELTFYPAAGFESFEPDEWDLKFGKMLRLPE